MIKHKQKIIINSDIHKVWFFMIDLSRSLIFDQYYKKIELKSSLADSLASAANYIHRIGWKKNQPCFIRVKLTNKIKDKYTNLSARKISSRLKLKKWKQKGVINLDQANIEDNLKAALILPDGKPDTPTFLVFENYEKILKWNRSLRFGISVCTLASMIKI